MKKIKIFMIHPYINSLDEMISYLSIDVLKIKYYFEWCPNTPDYLVVSEHIYINKKCNILFKKLAYNNPVTIFCAGEAETPDFNIFDYAVSFDSEFGGTDSGKYELYKAASNENGNFGVAVIDDSTENAMTKAYARPYYKVGSDIKFGDMKVINFN